MSDKYFACFDIGGTAIKYGTGDSSGRLVSRNEVPTETGGGQAVYRQVERLTEEMIDQFPLDGICISTAGVVDPEAGRIVYAGPTIPDYTGVEFRRPLEKRFGIRCEVENDVNCAGLAEQIFGAARESSVTLCVTVGTGIGGCLLIDGALYRGAGNAACEIGYMPFGCTDFQSAASASALSRTVARRKKEKPEDWDGRRIFAQAPEDIVCADAVTETAINLGRGIAAVCCIVNPETVILGGGVLEAEGFFKSVSDEIVSCLPEGLTRGLKIRPAEFGNDAGMIGALANFRHRTGNETNESVPESAK